MPDSYSFLTAFNGTLTDEDALAGDMPENLRDAIATNLGEASAVADADTVEVTQSSAHRLQTFTAIKTWIKSWIVKGDVGLGNVNNTSDASKPISTLTQAALDLKAANGANSDITSLSGLTTPLSVAQGGTGEDTLAELKTAMAFVKADVGLGNVDNTSNATERAAAATLINKIIDAASNTISNLATSMFAANVIDTDTALAANSDTRLASQKAVKAYADGLIEAANALQYKGTQACASNPNYPAANAGHLYVVSSAGKIGGGSGLDVEIGDALLCKTDSSASGTHAAVGANWDVLQFNLVGALTNANIGSTVQAWDADLDAIAALSPTNNDFMQRKSGAWTFRTPTQVTDDLIAMVGDSGSGGTKGLVPAPASGDAAAGKFLKADGTFAVPSSGGDALYYIGAVTAAAQASIEFTGLSTSYDEFLLVLQDVYPSTSGQNLILTCSINNGSSYIASGYYYSNSEGGSSYAGNGSNSTTNIPLTTNIPNTDNTGVFGEIRIFTGDAAVFRATALLSGANGDQILTAMGGVLTGGTKVNAIKLTFASNITGNVKLYGIKNS